MITAHHLFKTYQIKPILVDVSLHIGPGDRVGLIGANGSGKSTLMRILAGKEAPDGGVVTRHPSDLRIGFLDQGLDVPDEETIKDLFFQDTGDLGDPESELVKLANLLVSNPEREDIQSAYDETLSRLNNLLKHATQAKEILEKFGLGDISEEQPIGNLSGGQKTRLALARIILEKPDLLLLDEPTNHLDISMLEWMEDWLRNFSGGALIVSHDRTFLDNTVNQILDLDPATLTLKIYNGNYSAYLEQYLSARDRKEALYRNQEAEIRRLRQDINRTKQQALHVELTTTSRQPGVRRYAKKVAQKAKSREKKLDRYLESDERIEKPGQTWQMKLQFIDANHRSQDILRCEGLSIGYPGFPPLVENINLQVRAGERIAITGPNGGGKTTLLRTIAGELQQIEGTLLLGSNIRLGYMSQEQENLAPKKNALEMIQSVAPFNDTDARSFLHYYLFSGDDPLRPIQELSYGERARLSLALLVAEGNNLILLDEPINHLDIPSRARFEQALNHFSGTVLAVVHDRYFIHRFASSIWTIANGMLFQERLNFPS